MAAGVSGTAVAVLTAGAVLAYAGFTDQNPLQALRSITSGNPAPVGSSRVDAASLPSGTAAAAVSGALDAASLRAASGAGAPLVAAASRRRGERYSQARRWSDGFSDCSSFVGKAFKDIGVAPPPLSTTWTYLAWPKLSKVDRSAVGAGDLCVNTTHMIICVDARIGIGQQNTRDNVQVDTIEELMAGTGTFVCLRYRWGR